MKKISKKSLGLAIILAMCIALFMPKIVSANQGYKNTFVEGGTQSETVDASTDMTEYINQKKAAFETALAEAGLNAPALTSMDYNELFSIDEGNYKYATMDNAELQADDITVDNVQYKEYKITYTSYTVTKAEALRNSGNTKISSLNINIKNPIIGQKVTVEEKTDPEWGFAYWDASLYPEVTFEDGANYDMDWTAYIVGYPSEIGDGYDELFEGTFEADKDYVVEVSLVAKDGYTFAGNDTMDLTVNGEKTNYELALYNADDAPYFMFYAKVKAVAGETQVYELTCGDYTATFTDEAGHDYQFEIFDVMSLTEAQRAEFGISEEEYNEALKAISETTKDYGSLLCVFAINIGDEIKNYEGPITLKMKMTDKLANYESFKFLYVDEDNNFKVGETAIAEVDGGFITVELPHLSAYALVGTEKKEESKSPKAGDAIIFWSILAIVSIIGVATFVIVKKHSKK